MIWDDFPLQKNQKTLEKKDLEEFGKDWTHQYKINPLAIIFPHSHKEVELVTQWALKHKLSIVPSGGRTGLSGGACATNQEIVISFSKMNKIRDWNEISQIVTCEAGVVTQDLQNFAKEKGYFFPVDFAATGSSQVGGNVATNAGGIKVIHYGMMRNWIAGMKVVTASGKTLNLNKNLIKNATGYDLKQLFIGSEGTLGLITECSFFLTQKPPETITFLLSLKDLESLFEVYKLFKKQFKLFSFEVFTDKACEFVEKMSEKKFPISKSSLSVIFEIEKNDKNEKLSMELFEKSMEKGYITDGTLANSKDQQNHLWSFRENISESLSSYKPYKNDISVSPHLICEFMMEVEKDFKTYMKDHTLIWFGHIGDGNIHINILKNDSKEAESFEKDLKKWNEILFEKIQKVDGSVSAEHGIGLLKKQALKFSKTAEELELMKQIKKVLDPENRMNPGKIFKD